MTTIRDLCLETFGQVPARWRPKLERMETAFTPDQLEEAFRLTKQAGGKSIQYVQQVAEGLRAEAEVARSEETGDNPRPYWFRWFQNGAEGGTDVQPLAPPTAEEVAGYPTESLLWWQHQPSGPKELIAAELRRRQAQVLSRGYLEPPPQVDAIIEGGSRVLRRVSGGGRKRAQR